MWWQNWVRIYKDMLLKKMHPFMGMTINQPFTFWNDFLTWQSQVMDIYFKLSWNRWWHFDLPCTVFYKSVASDRTWNNDNHPTKVICWWDGMMARLYICLFKIIPPHGIISKSRPTMFFTTSNSPSKPSLQNVLKHRHFYQISLAKFKLNG